MSAWHRTERECDGCGQTAPVEDIASLCLMAPLGMTFVHVHRVRECAEAAREARGGGTFQRHPPGRQPDT